MHEAEFILEDFNDKLSNVVGGQNKKSIGFSSIKKGN